MSWFTSLFSSQNPARNPPLQPTPEPRILEEPTISSKSSAIEPESTPVPTRPATTDRPNRSKALFGAGAAFFIISLLLTRRAFARRRLIAKPAFYTNAPSHNAEQATKVNGAMEAFEALNIATVNVLSLAMMGTGGALWYLDINNMQDARRVLRGGLGVDGSGKSEQDAEEEFEEWLATTLARKEAKESRAAKSIQQQVNERKWS